MNGSVLFALSVGILMILMVESGVYDMQISNIGLDVKIYELEWYYGNTRVPSDNFAVSVSSSFASHNAVYLTDGNHSTYWESKPGVLDTPSVVTATFSDQLLVDSVHIFTPLCISVNGQPSGALGSATLDISSGGNTFFTTGLRTGESRPGFDTPEGNSYCRSQYNVSCTFSIVPFAII